MLIYDTCKTTITSLEESLKQQTIQYQKTECTSAFIEILEGNSQPDLIIFSLDTEASDMLLIQLKNSALSQKPIIYLTEQTECSQEETDRIICLNKPIRYKKLSDTLEKLLSAPCKFPNLYTPPEHCSSTTRNPKHILLAEDDPINRQLMGSILRKYPYNLTVAKDGNSAYEIIEEQRFDLIIVDLQMPQLNGLELSKKIRLSTLPDKHSNNLELNPSQNTFTPILTMSANLDLQYTDRLKFSGINDWLPKPYSESALIKKIQYWTESHYEKVLNWETLEQQVSGNQSLAIELIERFFSDLPKHRHQCIKALLEEDESQLRHTSHQLLGASQFCSFANLARRIKVFEGVLNTHGYPKTYRIGCFVEVLCHIDAILRQKEQLLSSILNPA